MTNLENHPIPTPFTQLLNIKYPIIAAPMFLVSNADLVVAASDAGAIGAFPALNYRPIDKYHQALSEIKTRTLRPIAVNIIVNKSNTRQNEDLKIALDHGVDLFITSLGNPKSVIKEAHKNGAKVFCDVTQLEYALKVEDLGADGVIAVCSGAGGHAGPTTPFVLIPWLKSKLSIPVIAAGGIATGESFAAALALGADGVSIGTRFIASTESQVSSNYKQAILDSSPDDIVLTSRVSGTPATVINTEYIKRQGTDLHWTLNLLKSHHLTKQYVVPFIHWMGMKNLENAAKGLTWKTVWSAGQSVGLINDIQPTKVIIETLVHQYHQTLKKLMEPHS